MIISKEIKKINYSHCTSFEKITDGFNSLHKNWESLYLRKLVIDPGVVRLCQVCWLQTENGSGYLGQKEFVRKLLGACRFGRRLPAGGSMEAKTWVPTAGSASARTGAICPQMLCTWVEWPPALHLLVQGWVFQEVTLHHNLGEKI